MISIKVRLIRNYNESTKEMWTNGDLNPGPFTCAHVRSENHTPRPFARQYMESVYS